MTRKIFIYTCLYNRFGYIFNNVTLFSLNIQWIKSVQSIIVFEEFCLLKMKLMYNYKVIINVMDIKGIIETFQGFNRIDTSFDNRRIKEKRISRLKYYILNNFLLIILLPLIVLLYFLIVMWIMNDTYRKSCSNSKKEKTQLTRKISPHLSYILQTRPVLSK